MLHILALPGWYPSRLYPYNGDFVQRHLQAISLYCKVTVVYVLRDAAVTKQEIEKRENKNLTEYIVYIPLKKGVISKWGSYFTYWRCVNKLVKKIKNEQRVDILHLHVVKFNGVYAWIGKKISGQPYLVTEHSTEYVDGSWENYSSLKKWLLKKIFHNATAVHCVSLFQQEELRRKLGQKMAITVIPNVVNTDIFYPPEQPVQQETCSFIHISSLNDQKDIPFLLNGFLLLKESGRPFHLTIVGPAGTGLDAWIAEKKMNSEMIRVDEMPQPQLASCIQRSAALVLFSKYETFGCVIIEAMACGKPVIVNDLPVMKEIVTPGKNGLICKQGDVKDLAQTLVDFIDKKIVFQSDQISRDAGQKYSYPVVAKQFLNWYERSVKLNSHVE
jgi:glycosyltransferase involved in cell wall biosynthesis